MANENDCTVLYEQYLSVFELTDKKKKQIYLIGKWDYNYRQKNGKAFISPMPFELSENKHLASWNVMFPFFDGIDVLGNDNIPLFDEENQVFLCGNSIVAEFLVRNGFRLSEKKYSCLWVSV